jgi:hypothetical protein
MLPLVAIGGVIGAVMSVVKGASWLSDQLGSGNTASVGGKGDAKAATGAATSSFETALAAQAAGQTVPTGIAGAAASGSASAVSPTLSASMVSATHGVDQDALARMNAGIAAYSHIGQHHAKHPAGTAKPAGTVADAAAIRS